MNAIEKAVKQAAEALDSPVVRDVSSSTQKNRSTNTELFENPDIAVGANDANHHHSAQPFSAVPKPKFEEIDSYLAGEPVSSSTDNAKSKDIVVSVQEPKKYLELPLKKLKSAGCIAFDDPRSQTAEEYRHIKRPILSNLKSKEADSSNIVMVTSSVEGEGKTFTAINLALSIAMEKDKTVLLIDCDPATGSLGTMLGFPKNTPGLIDLLTGKIARFKQIIHQTNVPNLRVIPVGENDQNATELLASERMHSLVQELSERYSDRVVIFDAPPIIPTTEAKVIAGLVGQIVFVVEAVSTGQSTVTEALSYLNPEKPIGLVLNKTKHKNMPGYGYTYNYGKPITSGKVAQRS